MVLTKAEANVGWTALEVTRTALEAGLISVVLHWIKHHWTGFLC